MGVLLVRRGAELDVFLAEGEPAVEPADEPVHDRVPVDLQTELIDKIEVLDSYGLQIEVSDAARVGNDLIRRYAADDGLLRRMLSNGGVIEPLHVLPEMHFIGHVLLVLQRTDEHLSGIGE